MTTSTAYQASEGCRSKLNHKEPVVVRLHFAVVHYFNPEGGGRHGSLSPDSLGRANALRELILQLHRLFGRPEGALNHVKRRIEILEGMESELKISICITKDKHLLNKLDDLESVGAFQRVECEPEQPKHLGFHCHRILKQDCTRYDYNCYLEDDIIIKDADFFKKLKRFNQVFSDNYLLQPNRIETSQDLKNLRRFLIDGDYNPGATEKYRQSMHKELYMDHLGESILFKQPFNTHSGCFFLNAMQSRIYFDSEYWNLEDTSFHGPLESAATLGVMKVFQIMKPHLSNSQFLTVEHAGRNFIGMLDA